LHQSGHRRMQSLYRTVSRWIWPSPPALALPNDGRLCWIDLEMTGLDPTDRIIEIACIVTDRYLNALDEGVSYPVKTDKAVLDAMGEWCTEQHGATGLTKECLSAPYSMREVEDLVLKYVRERMPEPGKALLAGSSVHVDKRWLLKDMPRLVRACITQARLTELLCSTPTCTIECATSRPSKVSPCCGSQTHSEPRRRADDALGPHLHRKARGCKGQPPARRGRCTSSTGRHPLVHRRRVCIGTASDLLTLAQSCGITRRIASSFDASSAIHPRSTRGCPAR
jgi:oligoribonuclease (3'-5' exoribonuclease)